MILEKFREIWCVDFEFRQPPGEPPDPLCVVATEIKSNRWVRLFRDRIPGVAPYSLGNDSLFVAFAAAADLGCHITLGWDLPCHVVDLFAEFRNRTNFIDKADQRANLLSALAHFRIPHITGAEKTTMRNLVLRGGVYSPDEKTSLLKYCESDVAPLCELFRRLIETADIPQVLERGRYARAVAMMEAAGVPIDTETLGDLRRKWINIHLELISRVDRDFHVFDGTHFRFEMFEAWLKRRGIEWPRTPKGRLSVEADTFRSMSATYPELHPLRELRATLSSMKLESLSVGSDGRNRVSLKPFASLGGRNQPSTSSFIFGPATWIRYLIKPKRGYSVAYIDYAQQEFAVAAVLSGDSNMQEAYLSSDPYLEFAKQAGAVPPGATKKTHGAIRDQFKACALAVMYGMGPKSLSLRIGRSENEAKKLIDKHQRTYPNFWAWIDKVLATIQLQGHYTTRSGWTVRRTLHNLNEHHRRSLRNFPVQATAADIFRLSCCLGIERGVKIVAPVHDACLVEMPLTDIVDNVSTMQEAMAEASRLVLDGFEIRTEAKVFTDRFEDPRGQLMWNLVCELLRKCQPGQEQYVLWGT
jgi:DNA polymerase I